MTEYPIFDESVAKATVIGLTLPMPELEQHGACGVWDLVTYCARVSNEDNRTNFDTGQRLLDYCERNQHWSVFEMSNAVVEIVAPRDITRQILRHRSFSFQELSGRYSEMDEGFVLREYRKAHPTNRQSSIGVGQEGWIPVEDDSLAGWWLRYQTSAINDARTLYSAVINQGCAKEVARCILPEGNTLSRMCMNGTLRSWLHYLDVRLDPSTQKEHRIVAEAIRNALGKELGKMFEKRGEQQR